MDDVKSAAPGVAATSLMRVDRLLRPASIAIVGISPEPGSFGATMLSSLESFGYGGAIHLVSRSRSEAFGRPCVPSIDDLPMEVDLAVLCVPRAGVLDAVAACGRRRIGGAIVFASGFAETGADGLAEQKALIEHAAALQRRTVTDFVLTSVRESARRAIEEHRQSFRFVTARPSSKPC